MLTALAVGPDGAVAYRVDELIVFNRWGQEVYSSKGYTNKWNGTGRSGQPLVDDTYFYVLNLTADRTYNGFVIIKR